MSAPACRLALGWSIVTVAKQLMELYRERIRVAGVPAPVTPTEQELPLFERGYRLYVDHFVMPGPEEEPGTWPEALAAVGSVRVHQFLMRGILCCLRCVLHQLPQTILRCLRLKSA